MLKNMLTVIQASCFGESFNGRSTMKIDGEDTMIYFLIKLPQK